jgi:protein-S-isoprenylcysteine O-methyltransferase Ste14
MKKCVVIESAKLIGIGIGKFVACAVGFIAAVAALGYVLHYYHVPEWISTSGVLIVLVCLLIVLAVLVLSWAHMKYEEAQVICMMRAEREDRRRS